MNMLMVLLAGLGLPAKAFFQGQSGFSPETTGYSITYSSTFTDGYVQLFNYYPASCAVRFAVPVYSGTNAVQINAVETGLFLNYTAPGFTDEFSLYTDSPDHQNPGALIATLQYTLSGTMDPGIWLILIDDLESQGLVIPAQGDSAVFWFVQDNVVSSDLQDTVLRLTDTTVADNYTTGYNFVKYNNGPWVDLFNWGWGNDFAVKLWYTPTTVDVCERDAVVRPGLRVYPNPARGSTTVDIYAKGNVKVRLYDPAGRALSTVFNGSVSGHRSVKLELDALKPGVYMLEATSNSGSIWQKITVR